MRVSQDGDGVHNICPFVENASRLSIVLPVTSFTVNPSRVTWASDRPTLNLSRTTGPDAPPRTAHAPWLPNGTENAPVQAPCDGRVLDTLTSPPSVFLP